MLLRVELHHLQGARFVMLCFTAPARFLRGANAASSSSGLASPQSPLAPARGSQSSEAKGKKHDEKVSCARQLCPLAQGWGMGFGGWSVGLLATSRAAACPPPIQLFHIDDAPTGGKDTDPTRFKKARLETRDPICAVCISEVSCRWSPRAGAPGPRS
jgi:hypothetical protein